MNSFFYLQAQKNDSNARLIDDFESYAESRMKQLYLIDAPLGEKKYFYDFEEALVLLAPDNKITFVNYGKEEQFSEYVEDFLEDLGSISDKFRYKDYIGRPRSWRRNLIETVDIDDIDNVESFMDSIRLNSPELKRKCELLISLLTGSINDIEKVKGSVPDTVLDKVKRKILLFDGDQTRFVYQEPEQKRVTIQGLSGTGKTELLLHKLKEIYVANSDCKVAFTCHNKILADSLRRRIPDFFNFMKVEEQIKWNDRLWCVSAWGSQYNRFLGIYSYLTQFYDIPFYRYNYSTTFDVVCKKAIEELKSKGEVEYAYDYMLIDESQDFPDSFFELCEMVTRHTVYIAGDIFQSIFDDKIISEINPTFLLSKCYRTDPKTLMFAHALGMGLFETPKLRWLEDKEWEACGYIVEKNANFYELSREPLRRFEDLEQEGFESTELVKTNKDLNEDAAQKIIEIIKKIQLENPSVTVNDIGIIFIDNSKNTYRSADQLEIMIPKEFGWQVNKAYESKEKIPDELFVSNKNNVKGLEFPFVICVTKTITDSRTYRNALYMMLTRSFLRTYLLISKDSNGKLADQIEDGLRNIQDDGVLRVIPPSEEEKRKIVTSFKYDKENISFYDFVTNIFDEIDVENEYRTRLFNIIKDTAGESFDYDRVFEIAEFNYSRMIGDK